MRIKKTSFIQFLICLAIFTIIFILVNNLYVNLISTGLGFNFNWLYRPASFALAEHVLPYSPSDSYAWALFNGWLNSIKVIIFSLLLSTLIGIIAGLSRISRNNIIRFIAKTYVTIIRQTPLLLQLLFWYFVGFLGINNYTHKLSSIFNISNQGVTFLGINLSPEFSALLLGLSFFTGAYIAEVIRGGLNSVKRGQWEAFQSLGISNMDGLRKVIIPQALPAIIPGLTSQYLNLAKNSTLAIAVGYSDIYAVSDTLINQTGRSIEGFILLLISFLLINLLISNSMEYLNSLVIEYKK